MAASRSRRAARDERSTALPILPIPPTYRPKNPWNFLSYRDYGEPPYNTPNTTRYFTRGLPTDIKVYSESGPLKSWKRLEYRLAEAFPSVRRVPGIVFHREDLVGAENTDVPIFNSGSIRARTFHGIYYEESYWMHPTRVTDILYDQNDASRFSRQVTEYQYNATLKPRSGSKKVPLLRSNCYRLLCKRMPS